MFEHLLSADPVPDRTTPLQTKAHAGKHAFLAWLSAPKLGSYPTPSHVSRLALLPVIAMALAGTALLACGTSDTPDTTASEQTAPTPTQVATQSMPSTAEKTSNTTSNGRSSSSEPTVQTAQSPTREIAVQEAKPTPEPTAPEPTTPPTKAPMPTATPEPQYDLVSVLAPHTDFNEIIQRMDDNGEPIYPLSEIKGGGDPKYPQYPSSTESGKPKYPGLASRLQFKISEAIAMAIGDEMFEQLPSDSTMPSAERLTLFLTEVLHKRTEWQVAEVSDDQITVNIFTHLLFPDPVDYPQEKVQLDRRVTATVVLELVEPGIESYSQELVNHYDKAPQFSHLVGEPEVTAP